MAKFIIHFSIIAILAVCSTIDAASSKKCASKETFVKGAVKSDPTCEKPGTKMEPEDGCRCAHGYARNQNHQCVKAHKCPNSCNGPNEKYVLEATTKDETCDGKGDQIEPENACRCKTNYMRDPSGQCINPTHCPSKCGPLEVYVSPIHTERTCSKPDLERLPPNQPHVCQCIEGYLRDDSGTCVESEQCPCSEENHVFTLLAPEKRETCNNHASGKLSPGCICKPGYVLEDDSDKCILYSECPPKCEPGETLGVKLTEKNCDPDFVEPEQTEEPKCYCVSGLYRNSENKCVPPNECIECTQPNTMFSFEAPITHATCKESSPESNGPGCICKPGFVSLSPDELECISDKVCNNCHLSDTIFTMEAPAEHETCNTPARGPFGPGCMCNDGFVSKTHLLPKCVSNDVCIECSEPDTEFSLTAPRIHATCTTPSFGPYKPGCMCKQDYVSRNASKADCVPDSLCVNCTMPDAVFSMEAPKYHATCNEPSAGPFGPGCMCDEGFVSTCPNRLDCVDESICNPCSDPNAIFVEGGDDENVETCFKEVIAPMEPGCVCKPNHLVLPSPLMLCVPEKSCPEPCKPGMSYRSLNVMAEPSCEEPFPPYINEGLPWKCYCEDGLYRNKEGDCVTPQECGICTGLFTVFSMEAPKFHETCGTPAKGPYAPGCMCDKGFVSRCTSEAKDCVMKFLCSMGLLGWDQTKG